MGELGNKIKTIRTARNLTQQEVADRLGVSRVYYSQWENDSRRISADQLIQLAHIMQVTLNYFDDKASDRSVFEMMLHLSNYFEDNGIPESSKDETYQTIMRLYLKHKERVTFGREDMPIAAHNDAKIDEKELKLMQEDIDEL